MEKALSTLLISNNELVAAVKNQISPMKREEYPSVTYEKTGRNEDMDMSGTGTGIIRTTFSITTRAKSYKSAKDINEMVKQSLAGPFTSIESPKIFLAVLEDEKESQLLDPDITEITIDYTFHHSAA
jgi:hypothetical protein